MKRRIVRLMVYTYDTEERMLKDMEQWAVPPTGSKSHGAGLTIRSALLPVELLEATPGYTPEVEGGSG